MKKQQGNAAIIFAMCLPILFGVFALGTDGARALQAKARLEDAAEVASLAVAAVDDDNIDEGSDHGFGSAANKEIAGKYIQYYMSDYAKIKELHIKKLSCDQLADCMEDLEEGMPRYFEYRVGGTVEFDTWFPKNGPIMGFGETFELAGFARARKYQSKAVDVLFVVDFSGSMNKTWSGSRFSKIRDVKDILEMVTDELQKFNDLNSDFDNRVALAGFNEYQQGDDPRIGRDTCFRDQRVTRNDNVLGEVRYQRTVDEQFVEKECLSNSAPIAFNKAAYFSDIPFTDDFDEFNSKVNRFRAKADTASYQGIIRAGQMAVNDREDEINPRQLIIILSDGEDNNPNAGASNAKVTASKLVDLGMCENILEALNKMTTEKDEKVEAKMSVIGFDYDLYDNQALLNCVGEENVFEAQNRDEILNEILALITEEIGHLAQEGELK